MASGFFSRLLAHRAALRAGCSAPPPTLRSAIDHYNVVGFVKDGGELQDMGALAFQELRFALNGG